MNKVQAWMFRVKGEKISLLFSLFLVLILAILIAKLSFYYLIGAIIVGFFYIKLIQAQYIGNALILNEYQFPEIYETFTNFKEALSLNKVNLCIVQDPTPNAFTIGFPTATIVLNSALVENFTKDELYFTIGHELGHVKAGHNIILTFIRPLGNGFIGASQIFSIWQRKAEYTADRCGLILNKKLDPAIMGLLKLAVGLNLAKKVDLNTYRNQLLRSEATMVKSSEYLYDHPLTTHRINKLVHFWRERFVRH